MTVDDLFSDSLRGLENSGAPRRASGDSRSRVLAGSGHARRDFQGVYQEGSGSFVSSRAPYVESGQTRDGEDGYTLNLVEAPIAAAAKTVLGDTLGVNYTIDNRVTGTISLQTSAPVERETLVELFETALAVNGASVVRRGSGFQIVPSNEALASTPAVSVPSVSPNGPGIMVQVIELTNIGAEEMQTILEPISRSGAILRADTRRNHLVLAGTAPDLQAMRDAIGVFDVDWMHGQSVALHPLRAARPDAVAKELETIFGVEDGSGVIRFVANDRLNSVLVITSRASYLRRAATWIDKLDRLASTNDEQLFVYNIQNRPAPELAEVLQSVLAGRSSGETQSVGAAVAPDLVAVSIDGDEGVTAFTGSEDDGSPSAEGVPSIVADVENNALLISTTAREYERIEQILRQLDVAPIQVLLEAVIAEVRLNDELKFGLRWAVESGNFSLNLSDVANGFAGPAFPGSSFAFVTDNVQITLNALASLTDVNIVSSPNILALNNQKALLQVGDQVPIVTQQATSVGAADAPVINSVTLKDTGIILSVLPRVNASGRVLLDIEQEVSNVVRTTTSGIDSPTIQQRKISTKVLVNDGESLALGGLIQEQNSLERGQVPIVGDIPIVGNLFKNKTDSIIRTELIIFIRPRVVRNLYEARDVTSEFRNRLGFNSALTPRRQGKTQLQRDLNRLKY
ncbi:type II secretion system secretin GspD [Oricola cellulosilytica]|uniref:Type II secretion system protein GspD n=1 Tax=Oricola cellulosilytica TaxID=1429082 RepID=A0A4R0PN51_9HYPH|nr:type II secretion system secretin GspD [Oricola cellulosilytica]TCD16669.1 type II secretion system protein GspD [Oricola cellulosilytica]